MSGLSSLDCSVLFCIELCCVCNVCEPHVGSWGTQMRSNAVLMVQVNSLLVCPHPAMNWKLKWSLWTPGSSDYGETPVMDPHRTGKV